MDLNTFISNAGSTKIVIGNGFDLHCGIHTKYSDYYCKNWRKYRLIQRLFFDYKNNGKQIDFSSDVINSWNVWDIFFALNSPDDPNTCKYLWCDIERLILASLISNQEINDDLSGLILYLSPSIHWPDLKQNIVQRSLPSNTEERFMAEFVTHKMEEGKYWVSKYYDFILDQLINFEASFGNFIYGQTHNEYLERINYEHQFLNQLYFKKALSTLDELQPNSSIFHIDSFNYTPLYGDEEHKVLVNYINGSYEKPIFGIDSFFEPDDERFIFTKTSRRIESKIVENDYSADLDFKNIIIYGHSLNEADYSYFFPIFDKLELTNNEAVGRLIFGYSIFKRSDEQIIKTDLRKNVAKLLYTYAKEKKIPNPKRFLDSVSIQKRVLFYEVDVIPKDRYRYCVDDFEEEWKKIIKTMEQQVDSFESKDEY